MKNDFDSLVKLHDEVKSFKIKYSAKSLATFSSRKHAKFNRTDLETARHNLSSTTACTYACVQYADLWNKNKVKHPKLRDLNEYWDYIVKGLTVKLNKSEQLDEFSILNILSVLKKIQEAVKDRENNEIIINVIDVLCQQFDNNMFAFVENPHPVIHYKFLNILEDWSEELVKQKKIDEKKLAEFHNKIYSAGKYEMYRQIALFHANDETLFDIKRLVYSLLIVQKKGKYSNNLIVDKALELLFQAQLHTGLLPIGHVVNNDFVLRNGEIEERGVSSRPILSSFECFNDLLSNKNIRNDVKKHYEKFEKAYEWTRERLRKNKEALGWYPEYESTHVAESWVTSTIILFLKNYCELLSEIISDSASEYLHAEKVDPQKLCDTYHIKNLIAFMKEEYHSALVFGPVGAGKSTIAKYLVNILPKQEQWKYIELIPGHFLSAGQLNIIQTINEIFKRLNRIKKAVVLFDQMDQLMNVRENADEAWVIAALLSKLEELKKHTEIRFILATNNINEITTDILKPGIIDLILPMGAFHWKARWELLEEIIEDVPDEEIKKDLMRELLNNTASKTKEESDLRDDPLFMPLRTFLEKTNFMSLFVIKKILEETFNKKSFVTIKNDPMYETFFSDQELPGYFVDDDYRTFHENLLAENSDLLLRVRLPIAKRGQERDIVEANTF